MITIPLNEVSFHPHSFADPAGRLFWWNGGLYRGLRGDSAELFSGLFRQGIFERLAEQGLLIDTQATDFNLSGYEAIIRHRVVPFVSYPEEWCPAMLKDAALTVLELLIELARSGLTLKDCHPWNLVFDRGRALYVDLTSIAPIRDDRWRGSDEFRRFYLNPLLLMAHGQERIARRLLPEYDGVTDADIAALIPSSRLARLRPALIRYLDRARSKEATWRRRAPGTLEPAADVRTSGAKTVIGLFREAKDEIEAIEVTGAAKTAEGEKPRQSSASQEAATPIENSAREILARLDPKSILDMGAVADGRFSYGRAAAGSTVLAVSTDTAVLTRLYALARRERLPLLPIAMDFADPTPARGLCSHWSIAARDRLACDMVLALANLHRYVFQRSLNFEQIAGGLASFSKRWVITEFVPADAAAATVSRFSWYNPENFAAALQKQFRRVTAVPVSASSRLLITCEK